MKLLAFRITNFRSIIDTGWCKFSPDNVTVLVGQNESGKSSILDALSKTFSAVDITDDDLRYGTSWPEICLRISLNGTELDRQLAPYPSKQGEFLKEYIKRKKEFDLTYSWSRNDEGKYEGFVSINDAQMAIGLEAALTDHKAIKSIAALAAALTNGGRKPGLEAVDDDSNPADIGEPEEKEPYLDTDEVGILLHRAAPLLTLFQQETGLLPNMIEIGADGALKGEGAIAARNFLLVAGIDANALVTADLRSKKAMLKIANDKITKDFSSFWSQTIGKTSKLQMQCELENIPSRTNASQLIFWISDGLNTLYPKQRSLGTRWFISFYLQLRASQINSEQNIFLLDEPGANLHSKAQEDVLRLINQLSPHISIIYSTHSPHMLEYHRLYRVLGVQRADDKSETPTEIVEAHRLGTASNDTLSPILTIMGVDISQQQVIKKRDNVLIEEMSGYYYLKAFWLLTNEKQVAHFIAATGAGKVEVLANMFRGWGLDFVVALDDDPHGRQAYAKIKKEHFGDDDEIAKRNMLRFDGCPGIEDVFSPTDFKKLILSDATIEYEGRNSEYFKNGKGSKPVLAYQFMLKVEKQTLTINDFDNDTSHRMKKLVSDIAKLIASR